MKSRIDEGNWIRCGKCSHKLARITKVDDCNGMVLEMKCHSCKAVNEFCYDDLKDHKEDKRNETD